MTREEAIKILEDLAIPVCAEAAFDMAIEALKQPEIIHCRECKHFNSYFVECDHENGLMYIIKEDHDYCSYAKRREEGGE